MCHNTSEMSTSLHAGFAEAISPQELALYAICFGSGSLLGFFYSSLWCYQQKWEIKFLLYRFYRRFLNHCFR